MSVELRMMGGPYGDATTNYHVETDAKTVAQLIEQVLKSYPDDWGHFCIHGMRSYHPNTCVCSYSNGAVERQASDYESYGAATITKILANGGWSLLNFDIEVEDYDSLPKQSNAEYFKVYFDRDINEEKK